MVLELTDSRAFNENYSLWYVMKYTGSKECHEFSSVCWPSAVEVAKTVEQCSYGSTIFEPSQFPLFEVCLFWWVILNIVM